MTFYFTRIYDILQHGQHPTLLPFSSSSCSGGDMNKWIVINSSNANGKSKRNLSIKHRQCIITSNKDIIGLKSALI